MTNGMEFGFLDFLIFKFIYFHQLNDELDKHEEKIFWLRKLWQIHSVIFSRQVFWKITGKNQSSYTAILFLNKLDLQQK